jgi:hypothetical protein
MKRVYKSGLITTLIGLIIILFAGILMYQQKANAGELSGWLAVGVLFLRSKDSLIGLGKSKEYNDEEQL